MTSEFSHILPVDQISDKIQEIELSATTAQCAEIAERLDLPSVEQLSARLMVRATERGIVVKGKLQARFAYACRVTREPFGASLSEPIDVVFTDGDLPDPLSEDYAVSSVEVLPLEGQSVDLAELLVESLALALDPFPRGPEADKALKDLGILTEEQAQAESSPFAALQGKVS
jgi:uncharacterized metal-binding protein YceD (DUF177 family)